MTISSLASDPMTLFTPNSSTHNSNFILTSQYKPITMSPRIRAVRWTSASRSSLIPTVRPAFFSCPLSSVAPLRRFPDSLAFSWIEKGDMFIYQQVLVNHLLWAVLVGKSHSWLMYLVCLRQGLYVHLKGFCLRR
jgi:hypothetical protein